jgi:molecular chaperone GrpE (heat shock protein)
MGNKTKPSEKVVESSNKIKQVKIDVPTKSSSRKGSSTSSSRSRSRSSKDYKVLNDEVKRLNNELEISKNDITILINEFNNYKNYINKEIEKINNGFINQTRLMKDNMDGINNHICTVLDKRENKLDNIGTNCIDLENKFDLIKKIGAGSAIGMIPLIGYLIYKSFR